MPMPIFVILLYIRGFVIYIYIYIYIFGFVNIRGFVIYKHIFVVLLILEKSLQKKNTTS